MLTVPAAVLSALGGLQESDPPVVLHGPLRHAWHPTTNSGPPSEAWRLLLPASSAALAAVVARAVGLDPTQGVTWEMDTIDTPAEAGGRFRATGLVLRADHWEWWFTTERSEGLAFDPDVRGDTCVPQIEHIVHATHALALVACHLAEECAGVPHGTWTPETT